MKLSVALQPSARDFLLAAQESAREQLQDVLHTGQLAGCIGNLVHMLQRERGVSNIWLCCSGQRFAAERAASRVDVDRELGNFKQAIVQPDYLPDGTPYAAFACALHYLEKLPTLRQQIDNLKIAPLNAMAQFNRTIRHLLSIVTQSSSVVRIPEVAQALTALYSLMQGKELAGQERALGAVGFAKGVFDSELRQELVDRIDSQQHCFGTFYTLVDEPLRNTYRKGCEPCLEIEQLRRQACTRLPTSGEPPDVLRWFSLLTKRIDALRSMEEAMVATVMQRAELALNQVRQENLPDEQQIAGWVAGQADGDSELTFERHLLPLVRQQAQQLETLAQQLASLQATLEERKIIEKAKALLICHQDYSEEQAWQLLRKMAMNQNKRMVEIATAMLAVEDIWTLPQKT